MASFILNAKSLPQRLWAEALNYATYIQNRFPHRSIKDKTPYKAWSSLKPEVARFLILFYDFPRFTWIYFLMKKFEVFQHLKEFKALVETHSRKKIKVL